ncbi:adenylate kinase [Ornithinimicrobium pekingense]|uniref:Adenylate kinase n=1 Tax=Ornithinimicrobium pekingense TaxID=384677 RepID=A0ABQ2F5K9_9MICO|nr:adenylate kinase [Ornithinimicrobium pekingense]GGK64378.1 hypothetical protein GCM10011509_10890 [Ornithinimicrobium pekingense]
MSRASVDDLRAARRVLVYGVTGAGKSSAAVRLGGAADLPVHLVDEEIGWLPGWQQRDPADQRARAAALAGGDRWILDSAYAGWVDLVLPRAQVVVALDYPRWLSLVRLLRRTARRWARREAVCNGNVETLDVILSRDSVLVWHVRSFARKRARIREWEARPDAVPVLRLGRPRELEDVLAQLRADPVTGGRARTGRADPPAG